MKRFSIVDHGYDIDEVNRFIDIVISRLEKLNTENATYVAKIDKLNQKLKTDSVSDTVKLEKAILAVQETADKMKEVSRTAEVLENKIEQYYTDCRTKEGTKNEAES